MDLRKLDDDAKIDLCRKYFIIGLFGLPLVWLTNAVWFFRDAFLRPYSPATATLRKYVTLSAVGVLVWFLMLFTWEFIFQVLSWFAGDNFICATHDIVELNCISLLYDGELMEVDSETSFARRLTQLSHTATVSNLAELPNVTLSAYAYDEARSVKLSRSSLNESFGFALQTYIFKRGARGLKERITYIDYVRDGSVAAIAGIQEGDVVVAVNDSPVLLESHSALVELMGAQLELRLVLLNQKISRILALSVRSLQLQYILAEKYILLEQLESEEYAILHGSEVSLSTIAKVGWFTICKELTKTFNAWLKFYNKDSKQEFYRLCSETTSGCDDVSCITGRQHSMHVNSSDEQITKL